MKTLVRILTALGRNPLTPRAFAIVLSLIAVGALGRFLGWTILRGALVALGVLAVWIGAEALVRVWKRRRADALLDEVAEPQEAGVLKEKFESAVARLKAARGGAGTLIDLPWYVIIGPPGSGKTTALRNAGLTFPLEDSRGEIALRGVGGTRDCDWWFADEAVLLDTAGRYTTQDSDPGGDKAAWAAFVELLKKHRRRRPLNGVFVAIGADILLGGDDGARAAHADAVRRRVLELQTQLGFRPPVYMIVTKTDLVAGFSEFFEGLTPEGRAQVWGFTRRDLEFDAAVDPGPAAAFDAEFDALLERLAQNVAAGVHEERDPARRARVFGFPQQVEGLRRPLREFLEQAFGPTRNAETPLVRGVYLTSGTQEGAPIDRLMGSIGRALGLDAAGASRPPAQARSYFIRDALKRVAFPEQDLLGLRRKSEVRLAWARRAAYAGGLAGIVAALIGWTVGLVGHSSYASRVADRLSAYQSDMEARGAPRGSFVDIAFDVVDRLDRLAQTRDAADADRPSAPRFGLAGGGRVDRAAARAYGGELEQLLAPLAVDGLVERIDARQTFFQYPSPARSLKVYDLDMLPEFVRAYTALEKPDARLTGEDRDLFLDTILLFDWSERDPALPERAGAHLEAWLAEGRDGAGADARGADETVVAGARRALADKFGPAGLAYRIWFFENLRAAVIGTDGSVTLRSWIGGRAAEVFERKTAGAGFDAVIPEMFTRERFERFVGGEKTEVWRDFTALRWAFGEVADQVDEEERARIVAEIERRYVEDYIAFWAGVTDEVRLVGGATLDQLDALADVNSPLADFVGLVAENTALESGGRAEGGGSGVLDRLNAQRGARRGSAEEEGPHERVARAFAPVAALVEGDPGAREIDRLLGHIRTVRDETATLEEGLADDFPPSAVSSIETLERAAVPLRSAPTAGLGRLLRDVAQVAREGGESGRFERLNTAWREGPARECAELVGGKFPFTANANGQDFVPRADFARIFGAGGVFDAFLKERLRPFIDQSRTPWTWRDGANGDPNVLREFETADFVCRAFFNQCSSSEPGLSFDIRPLDVGPGVKSSLLVAGGKEVPYANFDVDATRGARWPSDDPSRLVLTLANGDTVVNDADDDWHLFRMLAASGSRQARGDRGVSAALAARGGGRSHTATFEFIGRSAYNPFTTLDDWRRFRCPEALR